MAALDKRETAVYKIREFNRFYMPKLGLLGNSYLGSDYSPTEARVLFEVYENDGCNAAYIAKAMNIDKSYLSRVIRSHEKSGYLERAVSETDLRSFNIHLTPEGRRLTEEFIDKSNREIGDITAALTEDELKALVDAFDTVTEILKNTHGKERIL